MAKYDASAIQILKSIEAVRRRPAMYIGDTGRRGLHHLVFEVIDNSIDEAFAGYCNYIKVIIHKDNSVSCLDNGRGIPVDIHPQAKKPALEVVLTMLHAGGKFDHKVYKVSGGLHGVGVSVVNALSEWLEAKVSRDGKVYYQRYERGNPVTSIQVIKEKLGVKTGTLIRFKPDPEIFENINFDYEIIEKRINELAFLNKDVKFELVDERTGKKDIIQRTNGLVGFLNYINEGKNVLHQPIAWSEEREGIYVDIALQYTDGYVEDIYSFANNINTREGGTHLSGFKTGLTKVVVDYIKKNNIAKDMNITGDDVREGLTAVVAVKVPNPQFEGQTKTKLGNSEVKSIVEGITRNYLSRFFEERGKIAETIAKHVITCARSRIAAQKAREVERKRAKLELGALPGKLAECSERNSPQSELYIVEGDSAGGSAKQGRDRRYQAVLAIRGKILNVEKARQDKVFTNEEIKAIMSATGMGTGKLRYGKIILMTDADVDGSHIRTLLLTLFYRYGRDVIEQGKLYIAQPPLYKVKTKDNTYYLHTEEELRSLLKSLGEDRCQVQRFKGLGEMNPDELYRTTMDMKTRVIKQVTIEIAAEADKLFSILMGEKVEPRRKFIEENAIHVENLDI